MDPIVGIVVHGAGRGKGLGAPTLNMDFKPQNLPFGVYLGMAKIEQKKYSCIFHWGPRPTFHESNPVLEIHLLDLPLDSHGKEIDLYGKKVGVEPLHFLREVMTFVSSEALQIQIQKDLTEAHAFFA